VAFVPQILDERTKAIYTNTSHFSSIQRNKKKLIFKNKITILYLINYLFRGVYLTIEGKNLKRGKCVEPYLK
jgi:hypothetical protein